MLTRRAARRGNKTVEKRDVKKILIDLGFEENKGRSPHVEFRLYDKEPHHDDRRQIHYVSYGRGTDKDLRPGELEDLKKVLEKLDRKDLYDDLMGVPKKKKEKKIIKEVPFFSAWANSVKTDLARLSYDKFVTNKEEALYELYVEEALVDDPTLDSENFREELKHLVRLISNSENYYVSKISTANVLTAITLIDPFSEGEEDSEKAPTVEGILAMLDVGLEAEADVERHIEKLQNKELARTGDDIVLTEKGKNASASFTFHHKLLKLSQWMMSSGFKKEATLVLSLTRSGS